MRKRYIIIILMLISLFGCNAVNYPLLKGDYYESRQTFPYTLTVLTFEDIRKQPKKVDLYYVKIDNKKYKYNADDLYKNNGITETLSKMIAAHLMVSGIFEKTEFVKRKNDTDLVMTGKIKRYEGYREQIKADGPGATSGGGALVGVIYDSLHKNDKVEVRGAVELVDIQIKTERDGNILWQGEVKEESKEMVNWGDNINEFNYPERLLKKALDELVRMIDLTPQKLKPQSR
jgi:hypothetical protein